MRRWLRDVSLALACAPALLGLGQAAPVRADMPVVHAVIFYSPSCAHCHKVITEDLPPLLEKYGEQLQIIGVNTATPGGQVLFQATVERFDIPAEQRGVPMLVVGDRVLVGVIDIPQQFPGLIEAYLSAGGVDWPDIPGLAEAVEAAQQSSPAPVPSAESTPVAATATQAPAEPAPSAPGAIVTADSPASLRDTLARDPLGNTLSITALAGMVLAVGAVGLTSLKRTADRAIPAWQDWAILLLALLGLGVAGYLAYVETAQVTAVCGPVGDCNTVQQSEYALLFGLIPVALIGVIGYVAILCAWLVRRFGQRLWADLATLALFAMTLLGTLFSIYLTFLEPFVIGATCAWCLSSAVVMTVLMWLTAGPTLQVINRRRQPARTSGA